jgi:isopentenyldiphosphate isomerase
MELEELFLKWKERKLFRCLQGWRNERYAVYSVNDNLKENSVLIDIERSCTGLIGTRTYGTHLNGYRIIQGEYYIWVAKRSKTKQTWPGMLDNCCAGGLPSGYNPIDNMIKEAKEEMDLDITEKDIKPCGMISFYQCTEEETNPCTDYVFDMEFTESTIPKPLDKEVEWFQLMKINQVSSDMLDGKWKPEAAMVMMDFMTRHGLIKCTEYRYLDLCQLLKTNFSFPGPI